MTVRHMWIVLLILAMPTFCFADPGVYTPRNYLISNKARCLVSAERPNFAISTPSNNLDRFNSTDHLESGDPDRIHESNRDQKTKMDQDSLFYPQLPPIRREGSSGEVLLEDPIVPAVLGKVPMNSSSGSIHNTMRNSLALPVTDYGRAGGITQLRGLGLSAEDIDVQVFGISLNAPQGGGFDLSTFPQYLWSDYSYRSGPSLNALNQTSVSGTLALTPWTLEALRSRKQEESPGSRSLIEPQLSPSNVASLAPPSARETESESSSNLNKEDFTLGGERDGIKNHSNQFLFSQESQRHGRVSQAFSSLGVQQTSIAGTDGEHVAINLGYSSLNAEGPAGGLSTRWSGGDYQGSFHLLASDIRTQATGPSNLPTPEARMRNQRYFPVLQNDFKFNFQDSASALLKTSLFYDYVNLVHTDPTDPAHPFESESVAQQWGAQSALAYQDWKWGLGFKQISYVSYGSYADQAPSQSMANLQVTRSSFLGGPFPILLDTTFQGIWIDGYGFSPQASVGVRREWDLSKKAVFTRLSISRKYPSLLDRYAAVPFFRGNPQLQSERDWTFLMGVEWKRKADEENLQLLVQYRENARVNTGFTLVNEGSARIVALENRGNHGLSPWLDTYHATILSYSQLTAFQTPFPYVPTLSASLGLTAHHSRTKIVSRSHGFDFWEVQILARLASSRSYSVSSSDQLSGYWATDLAVQAPVWKKFFLGARVENILDRTIEYTRAYPVGRIFSVVAFGEL